MDKQEFRTKMREKGFSNEVIDKFLEKKGHSKPIEEVKAAKVVVFNENEPHAYCFQCKFKVNMENCSINKLEVKPNSFRTFIRGECVRCHKKVSQLVKNSVKTEDFSNLAPHERKNSQIWGTYPLIHGGGGG